MKPMLAHNLEKKKQHVKFPGYVQPKLDGVRCIKELGSTFFSRTEKPIISVPNVLKSVRNFFDGWSLDGELYIPGKKFEEINSIVSRKVNLTDDSEIEYWIFDQMHMNGFETRWNSFLRRTRECTNISTSIRFKICPTHIVHNTEDITFFFQKWIKEGFEGLIYRNKDASYEFDKRSNALLKLKPWFDLEAEIVDFDRGKGRLQSTLGALVCKMDNGKVFRVGSGLNDQTREDIWTMPQFYINKFITVKYQELTKYGVPRFPTFLMFREKE